AERTRFRRLFVEKAQGTDTYFDKVQLASGELVAMDKAKGIPSGAHAVALRPLVSAYSENTNYSYEFNGKRYYCGDNRCWKTTPLGMDRIRMSERIAASKNTLKFIAKHSDFPYEEVNHV